MSVVTFRLFKQRNNEDINTEKKEIVFSKEWKLIGVKIDDLLSKDIVKIKKEYKLDNLYSSQDKIKCLLKNAIYLDITFTDIKFFPELEDESDYKEIRKLLKNKDMEKLLEYIEEIEKREEVDIIGLKFILGVAFASCIWFIGMTIFINCFSNKITEKILRIINIICGTVIIFYGIKLFYNFIRIVI